jgi:hypothetical protein
MLVFLRTVAGSLVLVECPVFVRRHGRLGVRIQLMDATH